MLPPYDITVHHLSLMGGGDLAVAASVPEQTSQIPEHSISVVVLPGNVSDQKDTSRVAVATAGTKKREVVPSQEKNPAQKPLKLIPNLPCCPPLPGESQSFILRELWGRGGRE